VLNPYIIACTPHARHSLHLLLQVLRPLDVEGCQGLRLLLVERARLLLDPAVLDLLARGVVVVIAALQKECTSGGVLL
jgi:hypothetical protein